MKISPVSFNLLGCFRLLLSAILVIGIAGCTGMALNRQRAQLDAEYQSGRIELKEYKKRRQSMDAAIAQYEQQLDSEMGRPGQAYREHIEAGKSPGDFGNPGQENASAQQYVSPVYVQNAASQPQNAPPQTYNAPRYLQNAASQPQNAPPQTYNAPRYVQNAASQPQNAPPQTYNAPRYVQNAASQPQNGQAPKYIEPHYKQETKSTAQVPVKNQAYDSQIYVYQTRLTRTLGTTSGGGKPATLTSDQLESYRKLGAVYIDLSKEVYYIVTDKPLKALEKFPNLYRSTQDVAQRLSNPTRWGLTIPQGPRENTLPKQIHY